jgi:hypothetical protein
MSSRFQRKSTSSKKDNTLNKMDDGLLQCGTFSAIMKIIVGLIFTIIFGGIGVYLFIQPENNIETNAKITDVKCVQERINEGKGTKVQTMCTLNLEYNVEGEDYTGIVTTTEVSRKKNEIIKIKYDKENPVAISYKQMSNKTIGLILIGVGVLLLLGLITHIVLLSVSDWYKRLMCVQMVASTVSSVFSPLGMNNYNY